MTKTEREAIRQRFGGRCAYCGAELNPCSRWHVDHVTPMFRGHDGAKERGELSEKFPACQRCNLWKGGMTLDTFRWEIAKQVTRLRRDAAAFRLAEDFGRVVEQTGPVTFYFER